MKKIYSFLMALSIVLCANANSFEVAKSLEMSMARPQVSKKVNVTPSQVATPVINKTIQVKKQALNAQQQERKAIAHQAQSAPAVKVNGVRQIEAAQTATKQAMPTNAALKAPAKAAAAATDTVEIVATKWAWEYYESDNDWYTTLIDGTRTYEIKLDYVSDTQTGTFTEDDCLMDYTGMYIYDEEGGRTLVSFTKVDIVVTDDENGLALNAELLGENNTLYLVSALIAPLPEPVGYADLAYTNATLEDGTRSSETFQFWADENGIYTSFLIASDQVVGEYTQDDMYVTYANYIMFVDGTDTTFVDFLGFDMAITKEGQTYNLVADALGSDTIMYHITMSYTKPAPTDTIDIVATNMVIDEFEFWGTYFCEVSASNADYTVTLDMANGLPLGELTYEDFNVEYSSVYRIADATEIVLDDIISATVTEVDGQRAIKAQVVGVDNILYNLDLSYVIPEATDTVNVVFNQAAVATYYTQFGDYYIYNESKDYLVSLDIFEEEGNLMGEYTAEDFDLEYTQVGVVADSTVVTIVDAKAVVTPVEEDIVHIVAELLGQNGTLYIINTDVDVSKKGLQYDATEGFLVDEYTTEDLSTITNLSDYGFIYFDVDAADGTDFMGLQFWVDAADENTIIPVGTYPINDSMEPGTVMASAGLTDEGLTYSLYGTLDEEGNVVPPCWFMTGGEVVVTEEDGVLKIAVDAVNSNNLIIYVTCEHKLEAQQQGLPYDATAEDGELNRTYGAEDQVFFTTDFLQDFGMLFVDVMPADNSEILCVGFMADEIDSQITITPGTYEISASGEVGTVMASTGLTEEGYITESYFATVTAEGGLTLPLYFLVSGTVVVENVDGQFKMTVDAVNSNGIPVHVVYDPTATSGNDKTPLQYDATEGAVDRSYTTEEVTLNQGNGYFQILAYAADGTDMTGLLLIGGQDENTIIPVGTYEINGTQADGTVLASTGVNSSNQITLSFYGKTNAQGQFLTPLYFMVEGTVEVTAADGKLNIEVNALNSNDVPVHIVMEYDLNTKQGLQYDMQEGSLNVVYTDNDNVEVNTEYVAEDGIIYLSIDAANGSNAIFVAFFAEAADPVIGIPAGTYPINDTQDYGTVLSNPGIQDGYIYPSYYINLTAQGGISIPCYFMVSGQVVVENIENHLKVTIDALNSYDVPAHIVYEADPVGSAVENVTVDTTNASKVIENNQLFIIKEGVMYNVLGSVVK